MGLTCAVTECPDRAVAVVGFHYGEAGFAEVCYCSRHSWPWRSGRGNGSADVSWL